MSHLVRLMSMIAMLALGVCVTGSCEDDEYSGLFRHSVYLKAASPDVGDELGWSLVWVGDDLVVGAPGEDSAATGMDGNQADDSAEDSGAVYIFGRDDSDDSEWVQKAYLKASNTGAGDQFGTSVAVSGDLMAVGAVSERSAATGVNGDQSDDSVPESGAAYVFQRDGDGWRQEAYIKPSNSRIRTNFGVSVALWGDTLVVGAAGEESTSTGIGGDQDGCCAWDSGAVYVFRRVAGVWQQEAYIKASDSNAGLFFGISVSLVQDTLAVGAPGSGGGVYVFQRSGTSWREAAILRGEVDKADGFGYSVAAYAGDVLVVGAPFYDGGAAYVFRDTGEEWIQDARIQVPIRDSTDYFGYSVALSGRLLAVGATQEASAARGVDGNQRDNSAILAGAVYLFRREDMQWKLEDYLKATNTTTGDEFGGSLALRDGVLAVGAPGESSSGMGVDGEQFNTDANASGAVYLLDEL